MTTNSPDNRKQFVCNTKWHGDMSCMGDAAAVFMCLCVFSISVQCPVLRRQTLPPQPLNKPAQQRREHLFRTGPELSCGQIAYLINMVMEISGGKKKKDVRLHCCEFHFLFLFAPLPSESFSVWKEVKKKKKTSNDTQLLHCLIKQILWLLFHNCKLRNTRTWEKAPILGL